MNAPLPFPRIPLLDLDLLRTVVAIAETGSFSTAAEVLHRTPSAISMKVKKIEEILGRRVFCRDSREVSLTPDGAFLLEHARRMLALNRAAVAHFVEPDVRGVVRLGASEAERFLPDLLTRFSASHPAVTVNVSIENSLEMRRKCLAGELDLAIITTGPGDPEGERLYTEPLVWAACAGGIAASRDPLPISVWEQDCAWRRAAVAALEAQGRDWRLALESASNAAQRAAAALQVESRTIDAYHRLLDRLRHRSADESASGDRLMSDRSFSSAALRLVRAHAFLRGAPAAAPRDLGAIRYMVAHRLPDEVQEDFDHILEELLGDPPNVTMTETGAQMPGAQSQGDDSDGAAAASPASDSWIDDQADVPAPPTLFGKPPPPAQVDPLLRALVGRIERGRIDPDTDPGGQPRGYRPLRDLDELIDADLIEALLFAEGRLPGAPRTFERKRKSAGGAVAVLRDISASMAGRLTVWSSQVVLGILRVAARRRMRVGYVEFHHRALPHQVGGRLLHRSYSRLAEQAGQAKAVGQTNYEAPLRTALEGLRGGSGRNRHVVLLTDGLPIIGDTTVRRERQLARRLGVALHTVFLGNGDCPPVLDDISLETGGLRFYGRPLAGGGLRLEER